MDILLFPYIQVVVARNGGTLIVTSSTNMTSSIYELMGMLENDLVDGLLIDRYTLLTFMRVLPVTVPTSKFNLCHNLPQKLSNSYLLSFIV